jgi:hypothetical protein
LIVLGLGLLVLRVGWLLAWGDDKAREVALSSVERVEGHWQALLILLLPLFYLPIRRLIYRAKAFGDHPVTQEQPAGTGNTTPPGKGTQVEVEHTL